MTWQIKTFHGERSNLKDSCPECEHCGETIGHDLVVCEACCAHDDIDFPACLSCGKDMTEEYASAAYDRAKDLRKYGP